MSIVQVTENIFVGNDKYNLDDIRNNNICFIINVGGSETSFEDYKFHLVDGYNTIKHYNLVLKKMREQINKRKKILVHCREGKSRSPFIIALYLARHEKITVLTAIDEVKKKNKRTEINDEMLKGYMKDVGLYYT
jgi:protein tyrosine/serine phosphatase